MTCPDDSGAEKPVDVSIVIVSYNAIEWLPGCLASIKAATSEGLSLEVVVVDNASEPQVQDYLASTPHGVKVIQLDKNHGYGRACNIGIAASHGKYVLMLNPDAALSSGALDALVHFLDEQPSRGIAGGRLVKPDGGAEPGSCFGRPTLWSWFCSAVGLTAVFRYSTLFDPESLGRWERDSVREVPVVTGCLLMAERATWERLGGFDPDYFMYSEDADLSLRAWSMGFRPAITPRAVAMHAVGGSSGSKLARQRLLLRGKATFAHKHWGKIRARCGIVLLQGGIGSRALAETVERSSDHTMRSLWAERRVWSAGWPPLTEDERAKFSIPTHQNRHPSTGTPVARCSTT